MYRSLFGSAYGLLFLVFSCVGGLLGPRPWRWTGHVVIVIFGEGWWFLLFSVVGGRGGYIGCMYTWIGDIPVAIQNKIEIP